MKRLRKQYLVTGDEVPKSTRNARLRRERLRLSHLKTVSKSDSDSDSVESGRRIPDSSEQIMDCNDSFGSSTDMSPVDSEGEEEIEGWCDDHLSEHEGNSDTSSELSEKISVEMNDSDKDSDNDPRPPSSAREKMDMPCGENRKVLLNNFLCQCSKGTEGDAMLMVLALGFRHNLSWVAMEDILDMINTLYGRHVVHSSKYFLQKLFDTSKSSTIVHMYCAACEKDLGTRDFVNQKQVTQCLCGETVEPFGQSSSYFVSVRLGEQFRSVMERPQVSQEILSYRFQRQKENIDAFEDIYDGHCYKKFSEPGQPLSVPNNFSVTMNTDGMDLGASSTRSAWPIFVSINELPLKSRKQNMIFAGIWVGKKQPNMRIFLRPFIDEMKQLSEDGFTWTNSKGVEQISRVFTLTAILDSGARYKFLNMVSYSGYYGCTLCYQKAENTGVGRRFTVQQQPAELRTHYSMVADMSTAYNNRNHRNQKKRVHKGCKGLTPLVLLHPYLDLGVGVIVDYMHNALLGVTRSHAATVLQTANAPYYVGSPENEHILNSRLLKIKPPRSITRTPREITHCKNWQASEWRSFLLFYGIVCYHGVMKDKYLYHFAMLSAAFYLLLQRSVTAENISTAHKYLCQFIYLNQQYFGKTSMRYNIHLLTHVAATVQNWGPLWGLNTFSFEGENRHLSQMNTSPGHVALQVTRRYQIYSSLPKLCDMYASSETPIKFMARLTGKSFQSCLRADGAVLVGNGKNQVLEGKFLVLLSSCGVQLESDHVLSFEKMIYKSVRYATRGYCSGKKHDDSWIKTRNGSRGCLERILNVRNGNEYLTFLLIHEIKITNYPIIKTQLVTLSHIKRVECWGDFKIVKPQDIVGQCIFMELDHGKYIVDIPYGCHGD